MERHLSFASLLDWDKVVAVLEVDCVELFRATNSFLELIHVRAGVTFGNGGFVD